MASGPRAGLGIMQVLSSTRYVSFSLYLVETFIVLAHDDRRRLAKALPPPRKSVRWCSVFPQRRWERCSCSCC